MAEQADKHQLYEESVQCSEAEIDFVESTFRKIRKRKPQFLREDFCGTAAVCCEWVKRNKKYHAIGVDLDKKVLAWGEKHNLSRLSPRQAKRVELIRGDVLEVNSPPQDIVSAMNFSYWLFKKRPELLRYFRRVHKQLAADGVFFLDAYGGHDAFKELDEERELDGFNYVWEQARYNPVNGDLSCYIHFDFPDESRFERAFEYHWRLWTLPEIQEILYEAGFARVTVYWQGWDKDGEGDGNFKPVTQADADAGWICYISAEK
ncbi:MAG: class I SAM-dependent methyltransferase [gamma proteobacterium symbiont of Bathyaustriella thionipta]|nr:class I SAM-dependent methyltransferase [gamma proteobacterium symbiont of Bathyaustriella thionipta]